MLNREPQRPGVAPGVLQRKRRHSRQCIKMFVRCAFPFDHQILVHILTRLSKMSIFANTALCTSILNSLCSISTCGHRQSLLFPGRSSEQEARAYPCYTSDASDASGSSSSNSNEDPNSNSSSLSACLSVPALLPSGLGPWQWAEGIGP